MEASADMDCCLKVHSKCESCLMKTIEVLRSIRGVYSVSWDAQQSSVRVRGEVNPNFLLKAVMSTGGHAELLNVKLNHPQLRHNYYNYASSITSPYNRFSYMDRPYYHYQTTNIEYPYGRLQPPAIEYPYGRLHPPAIEYPYGRLQPPAIEYLPSSYDYETPLPRAAYVPSYPPQEYDPYDNYEGISFCTIM
ncbi:uncharacterized protein LOC112507231 isoform X1 [Cynara cardunculus var. scolymus]|uniref:uncharacterized protein LOC112507231 isoform X1 n=2 Tax=Cynara cardunculus var. scolymus TaxID=59895 RepID=UPI000D6305CF|nr:uncharacterized protein LOC112507231 isoform X1 [Cynara cardunculus var. scolymus]XP_024967477.1 uncharacterized protein LOC112507231 isoform X1 [Cynara cardunculus var. scolymus]XP_024967478.1 uncharacterized protein LOC112507231 isoform X1 [Cynara cardunculus var. scolymus]XP_024967479.1 uncharacterized protein LOC112507231 isoform X1 [Cynara cardunculus var. scolymus]XP_024967480.1 uncharacterized protein LOC112507231 isoform X1 [Cynara cardunculus var. scolymus]